MNLQTPAPEELSFEFKARHDLQIPRVFELAENPRLALSQLRAEYEKRGHPFPLSDQMGCSPDPEENKAAYKKLTDFNFERLLVPTMNTAQADFYFMDIQRYMRVQDEVGLSDLKGPVVIEFMHHVCTFSISYMVIATMAQVAGYNHAIQFHREEEIDPRLLQIQRSGDAHQGVDTEFIRMDREAFRKMKNSTGDGTVISYFGDLPPFMFDLENVREDQQSQVTVRSRDGTSVTLNMVSVAARTARMMKAQHLIVDSPETDVIRIRRREDKSHFEIRAEDWAYWPAIDILKS